MLKPPVSLALTVRVSPLSICLAVTVTPGNTAPVESRTTPEMAPEKPCPHTNELAHTITPRICTNVVAHLVKLLSLFTISPLSVLRCDTKFAGTPGRRRGFRLADETLGRFLGLKWRTQRNALIPSCSP